MRLSNQEAKPSNALFIPIFQRQLAIQEQSYEHWENRFKQLQRVQNILEKLNNLTILGSTKTEEEIFLALGSLNKAIVDNAQTVIEVLSSK